VPAATTPTDTTGLFDAVARTDESAARHLEGRYRFLNRKAGVFFDRIRATMEDWWRRYPAEGRADLRGRFRSGSDEAFSGAFWELYHHECLIRQGYEVTLHPEVPGTSGRPDFLARKPGDFGFYLEATVATTSHDKKAAEMRLGAIYDVLNDLDSPNFFLSVEVEQEGTLPPATKRLRSDLSSWLGTLDPDALIGQGLQYPDGPQHVWEEADWRVRFRPVPKSPERRGKPGRAIGIYDAGGGFIDTTSALRRAIAEKAGRYGKPDRPYVLAVLIEAHFIDAEDVANSLFGTVAYRIFADPNREAEPVRKPDGSWRGPSGPVNTRVSAVLTAVNLGPWSVPRLAPRLWLNPWASIPLADRLPWHVSRVDPATGTLAEDPAAATPAEVFGLPEDWPGPEDPFPRD
jgi:hypothetical protein